MKGTLSGIRVLDLSRILSGPFATMVLADLGADVIKVENTATGDDTRLWGPPFQGEDATYFMSVNRNKRAISVDLKDAQGRELVQRLADRSDIVIENFRPGTAERLGVGYAELSARNPGLIYASISGYGHTGPEASRPGYDAIAQAMSGMMSITGEPDGPPVRTGNSIADIVAGLWSAVGVLSALNARHETGQGQHIDISLFDGQLAGLTYIAQAYFASGATPARYGSAHPSIVPYQALRTADGYLMVAVGNDAMWRRFCQAIGLDELIDDERYATNADRVQHREALIGMIEDALQSKTREEWAARLNEHGVPAGEILTVDQALTHPQAVARDMVTEVEHPLAGMLKAVASPIKLSRQPPSVRTAPPTLGEHTDEVLAGVLGLTAGELADLRSGGTIR